MKGINCNIIRDLLPSYVDHICSEDSRHLIEEHMSDCEQCRAQLELLKNTEFTDEQGEQRRISYLKKVKRHYERGMISLVLLTLMVMGGFGYVVYHYELIGSKFFYIIFAFVLIAAYCLVPYSTLSDKRSKFSGILIAGSILVSIAMLIYYAVFVFRWNTPIETMETGPFGIPLNETGPYLEKRLIVMAVVQLTVFILSNILTFRGYRVHKSIYGLTLTGVWLAAGYIGTMHNMSTAAGLYRLLAMMTVCLILEGIVFSVAAYVFAKKVLNDIS